MATTDPAQLDPCLSSTWGGAAIRERMARHLTEPTETGCVRWTGARDDDGYGVVRFGGRVQYAHRVSYEINRGQIPAGLEVHHECRTRNCVAPDHLVAVSHAENCRRDAAARRAEKAARK